MADVDTGFPARCLARRTGADAFWMDTSDPALAMESLVDREHLAEQVHHCMQRQVGVFSVNSHEHIIGHPP